VRRETAHNFSYSDRRCFTRFRTFSFTIARRCQIADALVIQSRAGVRATNELYFFICVVGFMRLEEGKVWITPDSVSRATVIRHRGCQSAMRG